MGQVHIKRVYEPRTTGDGARVLVDRLWPRGVTKVEAAADLWFKDVAPSADLRRWFDHRADRWAEFRRRYEHELKDNPALGQLRQLLEKSDVTLLYAAKDEVRNHAKVLADALTAGDG